MENPLEYIRQRPQLAKQLIGLNLTELEKLIQQAIALGEQSQKEAEKRKIRVNKKGAGRSKNLSADVEIYLTLFYLRHMPIFEVLAMMFAVCRTTANNIFHYWLKIFRVAAERFRLNSRTYKQIMLVICGLVRLRIGAFQFSF